MKDIWEEKKKREEKEAILKGMSRAGKYWGRIGAYRRREGFHPLGLKKASEWFDEGKLFFDDLEENNRRKAHCKICGKELMKGEGYRMLIYASNWYNLSFYFGCEECKHKLEITTLQNRISSGWENKKMNNYVQLNSIFYSDVATMITAICFIVLIFAMGFCLGRIMRIKKLEDKWDKELTKTQKVINEILEKAGISKEVSLRREDNK